ncbi:hypothetical protein [Tenggerimyces flavus]|uniref:Uncharacterized protein n=1 Tax=Tenggerimyces flavus TaxID=1708749 RepID=A0ABV7Y3J7_9ACTN|nr:hypothetical protein [Tenggerimyces flavus]MBM7788622.1 hypothetical protein [Tenggerimyces flavus]
MRARGMVVVSVVLTALLAGCADDTPTVRAPVETPTETPSPSPTVSIVYPPPEPPAPPSPTGPSGPLQVTKGMTKPGSSLRFGQKAVVPMRYRDSFTDTYSDGVVTVTVQPIRRTSTKNLAGNFDQKSRDLLKGKYVYYARVDIALVSGDLSAAVTPSLEGVRSRGRGPAFALIGGELETICPEGSAPSSFDVKGARWATCAIAVGTGSSPIRGFVWDEPPYGKELQLFDDAPPQFNDYYDLGGITWR